MSCGRIHPGGLPPKTQRQIESRVSTLLRENEIASGPTGLLKRWWLRQTLRNRVFREVTGCSRGLWLVTRLGAPGIR